MKLTESQLRSIIRKELQEMMTPEFGEQSISKYDSIRNELEKHIEGDTKRLMGQAPDDRSAMLHELGELMDNNKELFKLFVDLFVK